MKPEIKARWITALKSDKYKQTKGALKNGDSYCCLGVLTDLYLKERKKGWSINLLGADEDMASVELQGLLPIAVQKWAGLSSRNPFGLSVINDEGTPFHKIADMIEEQL